MMLECIPQDSVDVLSEGERYSSPPPHNFIWGVGQETTESSSNVEEL